MYYWLVLTHSKLIIKVKYNLPYSFCGGKVFSMFSRLIVTVALLVGVCLVSSQPNDAARNSSRTESKPGLRLRKFLRFTVAPPVAVALTAHKNATLVCVAGGVPAPVVYWTKNGVRLVQMDIPTIEQWTRPTTNKPSSYVLDVGNTKAIVRFDCVEPEDSGEYACVAENGYRVISTPTTVSVNIVDDVPSCEMESYSSVPPKVVMWTTDRLEFQGEQAKLFCRAEGEPKPTIAWYAHRDQVERISEGPKYQIFESGDLVIRNLEWSDHVDYSCAARNEHGSDSVDVFLYPTTDPDAPREPRQDSSRKGTPVLRESLNFYDEPPMDVTFTAYRNGTLECVAGGTPLPMVYWTKDGVQLSRVDILERISTQVKGNKANTKLALAHTKAKVEFDCVMPEDSGEYTCVAENGHEVLSAVTMVHVTVSEDAMPAEACLLRKEDGKAAKIVMWTSTRFEYSGRDVKLICRAQGTPTPSVDWFRIREDEAQKLPSKSEKYEVLGNGDLLIRDVQWESNEDYACLATNIHGTDYVDVFLYPVAPRR